jgi:predicted membrane protein (TIGR00267 family)
MVKNKINNTIQRWKQYSEISNVGPITRRYFVMNAFDGALTMLGVVIGAFISGHIEKPAIIISAGLAGSIAMGTSGVSGAYMTERAERTKRLKQLEKALLTDMKNGIHEKSHRFASVFAALVDGASPALAAMFVVSPFFFVNFGWISGEFAFYLCIFITLIVLTFLGIYLARISDESMVKYGVLMLAVGLITSFLCVGTSILLGGSLPT